MILTAVFLLSLSALSFEILLVRVFSISQWNHLSFMVISITLFGFAAGGTCLNIVDALKKGWEKRLLSSGPVCTLCLLFTLSVIMSFISVNRIPLDYFRLPLEHVQALYLFMVYLLLSLPFFFTGLVMAIAYTFIPQKSGHIYFSSMAGSALGAIIPVLFLPFIGEGKLIISISLLPLIAIFFAQLHPLESPAPANSILYPKIRSLWLWSIGIAVLSCVLIARGNDTAVTVKPSPYKRLSQTLQFPHTRIIETKSSIRGRFDRIDSPHIRFAPGLSLKYKGALPHQTALFKDGDNPVFLYRLTSKNDTKFSKFTLPYTGYLLVPNPKHVLVIQHGGGTAVLCAMASNALDITVVEPEPQIASTVRRLYRLPVVNQNPRIYLNRSRQKYDVIHIENWGTSLPGTAALTQNYLFTIESFTQYFQHLAENGVLIVSRLLLLPPADAIRLWAEAYESLRSLAINNPEKHIAVLRNWNTFTMIVSFQPIDNPNMLKDAARNLNFDIVFLSGLLKKNVNRFNIFNAPYHYIEIQRLLKAYRSKTEKAYFATYPMDVYPQTDNRPFPHRFLKWSRLKALYKMTGSRFYSLFLSGEIIVSAVFLEAFGISAILLIVPFFFRLKGARKTCLTHVLYFIAVGAGFMFVELFFIKEYVFLFDDPVISLTVVLTGLLAFSGLGGYWSQRIPAKSFRSIMALLIVVLIFTVFILHPMVNNTLSLGKFFRYTLSLILLMPPGFLMGFPFPLGIRYLLELPDHRAYAWTINGCASVLAAVASAQIALGLGIFAIMILAIAAYFLAFSTLFFKRI